jgi:hypothetical protein
MRMKISLRHQVPHIPVTYTVLGLIPLLVLDQVVLTGCRAAAPIILIARHSLSKTRAALRR